MLQAERKIISSTHKPDLDNANVGKPVRSRKKGNLPDQGGFPYFIAIGGGMENKK